MSEETMKVTITVEMPKKVHDFLSDFAKLGGTTLNDILKDETETLIKNFYQGGFYEGWNEKAFKNRGVSEYFGLQK